MRWIELSKRLGFRQVPGFSERVVYREMFPAGLTLLDLTEDETGPGLTMSHVAARAELTALLAAALQAFPVEPLSGLKRRFNGLSGAWRCAAAGRHIADYAGHPHDGAQSQIDALAFIFILAATAVIIFAIAGRYGLAAPAGALALWGMRAYLLARQIRASAPPPAQPTKQAMSRAEALDILGLEEGASEDRH